MSMPGYYSGDLPASAAPVDARVAFIRRTYLHLAGAIVAFVALSGLMYASGVGAFIAQAVAGSRFGWLLIMGGFIGAGWLATTMAHSNSNTGVQYAGLALYTLAEAIIFSPLIFIAASLMPGVLPAAVWITLLTFGGLSAYVLISKKDFSFLRTALFVGSMIALGLIVAGAIFGFSLGVWFSAAMILFAAGAILYSTSRVLNEYHTDQHVAAALELFAAVALLFWYVLNLLMSLSKR